MKLAARIAGVVGIALACWWLFGRTSSPSSVSAVAPMTKEVAATPNVAPVEPLAPIEQASIETPGAEDSRAATPTPEPVAVATETKPTSNGLLRVHVFARETRKPLAGQRIAPTPKGVEDRSWKEIPGAHAAVGEGPLTDPDGNAEIEVVAGHELAVFVGETRAREPLIVPALAAGETRDVDVDVPTEPDCTLFGRIVDADTKLALADGA